jgi:hypothetical protein
MRRTSLALALAVVLALAGCGGEDKDKPLGPVSDDTASAAPSDGTPTGEESQPADPAVFNGKGHDVIRGAVEAATPEEQAVAEAWFAYWEVRVRSFGEVKVDPMIGSVAAADALAQVVRYVAHLKGKNLHTEGDTKFGVTDISVRGPNATLSSCGENRSVDQHPDGSPAEEFTPFYNVEGALKKAGGAWRVVAVDIVGKNGCKA